MSLFDRWFRFEGLRFVQLSVAFVLFMMLLPLLDLSWVLKSITQLFLLNAVLVAFSAQGSRLGRAFLWALWGISASGSLLDELHVNTTMDLLARFAAVGGLSMLALVCSGRILTVVLRAEQVTLDNIFASIVVYQLIGLFFGTVYTLTILADPGSLQLPANDAHADFMVIRMDTIYFSFVTLATLGYGDIVPVSSFARSVAVTEALVGQFYVAVVVALLIGAYVSQRIESSR